MRRLVGASIMPVTFHSYFRIWYILLGKERDGDYYNSGSYCDFGGGAQRNETAEACASREFFEETMAMVPLSKNKFLTQETLQKQLENREYLYKCEHVDGDSLYVTFVVRIEFNPDVQKRFKTMRANLLNADRTQQLNCTSLRTHPGLRFTYHNSKKVYTVNRVYLEKQAIQWFSYDHCRDILRTPCRYHPMCSAFMARLKEIVKLSMWTVDVKHNLWKNIDTEETGFKINICAETSTRRCPLKLKNHQKN